MKRRMTMPQMLAVEEKRKHDRIDKKVLLRVSMREKDGAPEWTIVTSKNISASGVLFGFNQKLDRGTPLYLRIHFPDHAIDCTATVRRSVPGAQMPLTDVAVSLKGLERSDRDLIESHVI